MNTRQTTNLPLEVKNVTIRFGNETVIERVSFVVRPQETVVLMGPSGEGKTVLLKAMAGIIPVDEGQVFIEGKDWQTLNSHNRRQLAKKVGMLFQKSALFDEMSCAENIAFPLKEHTRLKDEEIHERVVDFLRRVGLSEAYEKLPHELSGGMQKRLGIARALALSPEIVFYDDPTAGQDPITSDKIIDLIEELKIENRSTLVVVTNDIKCAYRLADRIIIVVNKSIIDSGSVAQTKNSVDPRVKQFIAGELTGPLTHN